MFAVYCNLHYIGQRFTQQQAQAWADERAKQYPKNNYTVEKLE